jgi:Zn-dependent M28 family amino/carboxypeptidase
MRRICATAVALLAVASVSACSSSDSASASSADFARDLAAKVTVDGIQAHLRKLQEIADANQGNRAEGTPGYDASLEYVVKTLRDKGFNVQTPEFERLDSTQAGNPTLTVGSRAYHVDQASLLVTTPPGGLNAITLRPPTSRGCAAADYGAVSVKGAIAVVDDTGCSVVDKQNTAVAKGAVGVLVVSKPGPAGGAPGLFTPGYYQRLTIPVGVIDTDADAAVRRTNAPVKVVLDGKPVMKKARNVVAQTKTGDAKNVVVLGADLGSPPRSPGINDNGSGLAALLETASALGSQPKITNAVRFTFWASVEGPTKYVAGLNSDELDGIALYLGFDMLGSLNAGYFTYDGDQSAQPNPDIPAATVPPGSAGIERTLAGYLNLAGARPADMPLSRTADYSAFLAAGIPIGGSTAGASQRKTEVQVRLWGGQAGVPFDPNYLTARDTLDNIDRNALSVMGPAVAFVVGTYAQSVEGVNGVPPPAQRHRKAP